MPGRVRYDPRIDYYAALDLSLSASADQIQSAFRQRAKQLHPDRNPDAEATRQFQKLSEAYAILSDPALRAEYDEARAAINLRAAFQSLKRERTKGSGGGSLYWQRVIQGLTRSPYRYVFLLLALVALANIAFVVFSDTFNVDSASPQRPRHQRSPHQSMGCRCHRTARMSRLTRPVTLARKSAVRAILIPSAARLRSKRRSRLISSLIGRPYRTIPVVLSHPSGRLSAVAKAA